MYNHKISQINQFSDSQIGATFDNIDQDSLVLFDIDEVLIMDQDEYRLTHPYRIEWRIESRNRLTPLERSFLFSIILKKRAIRLVDDNINAILASLWKRQIPTMALTKLYTGQFGIIEDFTNWRLNELKAINIDFRKSTPLIDEMLIEEMQDIGGIPTMKEGVILTANVDKGQVLENILHKKKYFPKKIIFVDDILENLESVSKICTNLQIDFQGFEFRGASLVPEAELDRESEKIRFEILEREHRWIPDLKL